MNSRKIGGIRVLLLTALLCATAALAPPIFAQSDERAQEPRWLDSTKLRDFVVELMQEQLASLVRETQPLTNPTATQNTAPGKAPGTANVTSRPGFTDLIALAIENDLVSVGSTTPTVSLNAFGFATLFNPRILDQQSLYQRPSYELMRRLGGSLTFGGKGLKFDRDGDGSPDEALEAESLDQIVTWEMKLRVFGSRNRRDRKNQQRYMEAISQNQFDAVFVADVVPRLVCGSDGAFQLCIDAEDPSQVNPAGYYDRARVRAVLETVEGREALAAFAAAEANYQAAREAAEKVGEAIDKSMIWTVVLGGVSREAEFGPNEFKFGLRGQASTGDFDHTLEIMRTSTDPLPGHTEDAKELKVGYELSKLLWKDSWLTADGVDASLAFSLQDFDDVPDAEHATIVKASGKLVFSIADGVSLPVSLTFANHKDLLEDASEVVGHFGLTLDLGQVLGKKEKK